MTTASVLGRKLKEKFQGCQIKTTKRMIFFEKLTGDELQRLEAMLKEEKHVIFKVNVSLVEDKRYMTGAIEYKSGLSLGMHGGI